MSGHLCTCGVLILYFCVDFHSYSKMDTLVIGKLKFIYIYKLLMGLTIFEMERLNVFSVGKLVNVLTSAKR
jgi:hypothetical protein